MKKYILLFLFFFLTSISAWAADETVNFSAQGYTNGQNITSYNGTNFSVVFDKGTNSNVPKYYTTGSAVRVYGGGYFVVSSTTKLIAKIEIGFGSGDGSNAISTDVVTYSSGVWEGESNSVKFTVGGSSGHRRIASIAVTYKSNCNTSVTLDPVVNGTASLDKNIVCPGDQVQVTYSAAEGYVLDKILANGVEVTNPITITQNTTIQVLFKLKPVVTDDKIIVTQWDEEAVYIDVDDFEGQTVEVEGQRLTVATELIFSKYFEAQGNIKLLGIFNGTQGNIDLTNYAVKVAQGTKVTAWGGTSGQFVYSLSGLGSIQPLQEIILISYNSSDASITNCILENNPDGLSYQRVGGGELVHGTQGNLLQFSGDDAVGLFKNDTLIDIIGAGNSNSANISRLSNTGATGNNPKDTLGHTIDGECWITGSADGSNGYDATIATNLCLLIRKPVQSGANAVAKDTVDFVTLAEEWIGKQVTKNVTSTCNNFNYVGTYDFSTNYSIATNLEDVLQEDGSYRLPISDLAGLACSDIKIIVKDNEENETNGIFQVPIMVSSEKTTNQLSQTAGICETCDIVVLSTGKLTAGTSKTKAKDITVYPNGELIVNSGKTYTVRSLSLLKVEDEVPQLKVDGTLNITQDKVSIIMRQDPSVWHFFNLPAQHAISDIKLRNGKTAEFGSDYWIKQYNGEHRAAYKTGSWEQLPGNTVYWGIGYIIGVSGEGKTKKDLIFNYTSSVIDAEKALLKTVDGFYAWGADKTDEELRPNHKGWHLVGNPYLCNYSIQNFRAPLRVGKLIHELNDQGNWTGAWLSDEETVTQKLRYVVVPIDNGYSEYEQVLLTDKVLLEPLTCYFVQIGNDNNDPTQNQSIIFEKNNKMMAPKHILSEQEDDQELFFEIKLTNANGEFDKTGFILCNKFSEKYEVMDDMMKWRNSNYKQRTKPVFASSIPECELAYNALNDSLMRVGVPLNYYTAEAGNYVISLGNVDDFGYIKEIYLYDNVENTWNNLMLDSYMFYTDAEDNKGRFLITAVVERENDMPTNINVIPFNSDNKCFDLTGKHISISDVPKGVYIQISENGVRKIIK